MPSHAPTRIARRVQTRFFPEGLTSTDEFGAFAKGSPGLLLANMTEFGKTPHISTAEFAALGYQMVMYPLSLMRLAMAMVVEGLDVLKREGSMESIQSRMQTRADLYDTLDYRPDEQWIPPRGRTSEES